MAITLKHVAVAAQGILEDKLSKLYSHRPYSDQPGAERELSISVLLDADQSDLDKLGLYEFKSRFLYPAVAQLASDIAIDLANEPGQLRFVFDHIVSEWIISATGDRRIMIKACYRFVPEKQ